MQSKGKVFSVSTTSSSNVLYIKQYSYVLWNYRALISTACVYTFVFQIDTCNSFLKRVVSVCLNSTHTLRRSTHTKLNYPNIQVIKLIIYQQVIKNTLESISKFQNNFMHL